MLDKLTSWWARLWEILSSLKDPSWPRLAVLVIGLALILMFGRRGGIKWLRTQEAQVKAYRNVVRRAKHTLVSVGGDSPCPAVLADIGPRMASESKPNLNYVRIISEPPSPVVIESLAKLEDLCGALHKNPTGPHPNLFIGYARPEDVGDVRVCGSEKSVILAIPLRFLYSGEWVYVEVQDDFFADHIVNGVRHFYESDCKPHHADEQRNRLVGPHS